MYSLYLAGNYEAMRELNANPTTEAYAEMVSASGADRYILDIDGNTKAMMYPYPGGYWRWYFGQMQGSLRHGQGAMVLVDGEGYRTVFTGLYSNDFPSGQGRLSVLFPGTRGYSYEITGNFQGFHLNGTYQVTANWIDEEIFYKSSLSTIYRNSNIIDIGGWNLELSPSDEVMGYAYDERTQYKLTNMTTGDVVVFDDRANDTMFVIGLDDSVDPTNEMHLSSDSPDGSFLFIFMGNSNASATVHSSTTTTADTATVTDTATITNTTTAITDNTAATTDTTTAITNTTATITDNSAAVTDPASTAITASIPGTYTVERGESLSSIAKKIYGDERKWIDIYNANADAIRNDLYIIYTNQVLVMP